MNKESALLAYVSRLGDNALVLGQRMIEVVAAYPELEEELANANFALDYIGQARMFYTYAGELEGRGVTVNSLHPGAVSTSLGTQNGGLAARLMPLVLKPFFLTPEQGARTSVYLCSSDEVADASGGYYYKSRPEKPKPWALDDDAAAELWRVSESLVGFNYPDMGA